MNVKIEILDISPKTNHLKNNQTETISMLLKYEKNVLQYDLEKVLKDQQKINLLINPNNTIMLILLRNNSRIIGLTDFYPSYGTKWLNIRGSKNVQNTENSLAISCENIKTENFIDKNNITENYNTIKNNNIDISTSFAKGNNTKSSINISEAFINNNIRIKIKTSMKIKSKNKIKINKNIYSKSPATLTRGRSKIIINPSNKNNTTNKHHKHNNASMKNIKEKIDMDNFLRIKKNLKSTNSSSSIKFSLNQIISENNKISLNMKDTILNSNENNKSKSKIKKVKDNDISLNEQQKQKTQNNFYVRKPIMSLENEKNENNKNNYYNNTITLETNNKKIEDLIIDNNFKNKLKLDEIINPSSFILGNTQTISVYDKNNDNSMLKTSQDKNYNCINKEISKSISSLNNINLVNDENMNKNNCSMISAEIKNNSSNYSISSDENELMNNFETLKNDVIIYYTKEYLKSINDDMLLLEVILIIEKILQLKFEYQKQYTTLFNKFKKYKNNMIITKQKSINIIKKNNKMKLIKTNLDFKINNISLFISGNKQYLSSQKQLLDNKGTDIWNNLLKDKNDDENEIKKDKIINLFIDICEKNVNSLNSLTKRYYTDLKKKNESKNKNKTEQQQQLQSDSISLVTIPSTNITNIEKGKSGLNSAKSHILKNNKLKLRKLNENIKTINNEKIRVKNNLYMDSKSSEKKRPRIDKFLNKIK